ncbi:MAG: beta-ketoacyl-ACP synthase II [Clostridia bacterium]|nr:beta-ketoacyl-ACP synthase II [Clostridia bacterium]
MERRVVITGLGTITPVGNDVKTFWESLKTGKNGITAITKFDSSDYKAHVAGEVKNFDPLEYMDKSELRKSDLFSQYAMAAAVQAMNDSGIDGKIDPERLGVYFGSGIGGIGTFANQVETLGEKGPKRVSAYFIPMMIANIAGGNIAIRFNAQGSCLPVTTACATSHNEIGEAYRAIKHGYLDAIIAGGAEAAITPIGVAGFGNMTALSSNPDPDEACCPFDKRRSGFVMGEGGAALILEEYEHAKARGAHMYAEIVGYGASDDAYHMTAPHPEGRGGARAIRMALEEAKADITKEKIYINAHGTSTPLNEKSETLAIKGAFGEYAKDVIVSSTKSMTGHMLGAAGAVEAIASALAVKENIVPPTINYKEPDPECDLDVCPNEARETELDLALSVSLGFGGHNACIALRKVL